MMEILLREMLPTDRDDEATGDTITITQFPAVMGRHPVCDHCVDHPLVSRRHCEFYADGERIFVQDLESRNGTCVNGVTVQESRALQDGDVLSIATLSFKVSLPVQPTAPAVKPISGAMTKGPVGQARQVLIVEDNEVAAETLAMLLKDWGHEVHVAHDGPEAILVAEQCRPDTVLLDIRLPGMDGYQVAQQLREEVGLQNASVVAITGYGDEGERQRSREVGISQVVAKPVDPQFLQELLLR
jgi:CheY-like chemotaxis protein